MSKINNPARITVQGRAAFLRIDKPERYQGTGEPRYSASIIIDPSTPSHEAVKKAMLAAAAKQWGAEKAAKAVEGLTKSAKVAYVDGDTKADFAGFAGNFAIQAHAKANTPPALVKTVNGKNVRLDRESQTDIYAGCYVNAIVEFWAQDNQYGKRINAQLAGLQFVRHGDPFSGGRAAEDDDFEIIEGDDDDGVGFDNETASNDLF